MNGYHQLTREQRYQRAALLANGYRQSVAASVLRVDPSTISRELARNGSVVDGRLHYCAKSAQQRAERRRIDKSAASRTIRGELQELVETKLRLAYPLGRISMVRYDLEQYEREPLGDLRQRDK